MGSFIINQLFRCSGPLWSSHVPNIQICSVLLFNWGSIMVLSLSFSLWLPSVLGSPLQPRFHLHQQMLLSSYHAKPQVLTHYPYMHSKLGLHGRFWHIAKFFCKFGVFVEKSISELCLPLDHSFCILTLMKYFPEYLTSMTLVPFIKVDSSAAFNEHPFHSKV